MNIKRILLATLVSIMIMGCGSKDSTKADYLYVRVHMLKVRKIPDLKAPAFITLSQGAKVINLQKESNKKFKATLRGRKYYEPFVKVKLLNGSTGWIYKAALSKYPVKKINTMKVVKIEQGDLMCYVTFKTYTGKIINKNADFSICEKKGKYLHKQVSIAQSKLQNVNDCESNEPCGKTKKVSLITKLKIEK